MTQTLQPDDFTPKECVRRVPFMLPKKGSGWRVAGGYPHSFVHTVIGVANVGLNTRGDEAIITEGRNGKLSTHTVDDFYSIMEPAEDNFISKLTRAKIGVKEVFIPAEKQKDN